MNYPLRISISISPFTFLSFSLLLRIRNQLRNQEFKVYYVGTNNGRIYKIVQFIQNGQSKSKLLDIFEVAQNEAIQVMEISPKHKSLYVSTDHRVKQIDLEMCSHRYDSCFRCVKDPYCGWDHDAVACKPYKLGLLQVWKSFTNFKRYSSALQTCRDCSRQLRTHSSEASNMCHHSH